MEKYLEGEEAIKFFKERGEDQAYLLFGKVWVNGKRKERYAYFISNDNELHAFFMSHALMLGKYLLIDEDSKSCYYFLNGDRYKVKRITEEGVKFSDDIREVIKNYKETKKKESICGFHVAKMIYLCFTTSVFDTGEKREE